MFRAWECALCMLLFIYENAGAQILPEVPSRDVQARIQLALDYDVKPKLVLTARGELRPGDDRSQFAEELFVTGANYSPCRFASFGTVYVYVHANFHLTGLDSENRVYLQARFNTPEFHGFFLSDGIQPELRWLLGPNIADGKVILSSLDQEMFAQRYGNLFGLEHPVRIADTKCVWFIRWARFYDTLSHGWTETSYHAGLDMPIGRRVSAEYYYVYRRDAAFAPYVTQAVGINFTFSFQRERLSREFDRAIAERSNLVQ
jgi:hypothetical protein